MTLAQNMVAVIDERIVALLDAMETAAGSVVTRTGNTTAMVTFDGSSLPVPVKCFGDVNVDEGDRVGMVRIGVDWTIIGTFTRRRTWTYPDGALPGQPRTVIGPDLPPPLNTYLFFGTTLADSGIIFYQATASNDDYNFLVHIGAGSEATLILGHVLNGAVLERAAGFAAGQSWYFNGAGMVNNDVNVSALGGDHRIDNVSVARGPSRSVFPNAVSATTVAGAPFSAEIVVATMTSQVFRAGRAYAVEIFGGFNSTTVGTAGDFYLRKGTTIAGTQWWNYFWSNPMRAGGAIGAIPASRAYLKRTPGTDLTTSFVLTMRTDNSATGEHFMDANHPRGMMVYDVGAAADFTQAFDVT